MTWRVLAAILMRRFRFQEPTRRQPSFFQLPEIKNGSLTWTVLPSNIPGLGIGTAMVKAIREFGGSVHGLEGSKRPACELADSYGYALTDGHSQDNRQRKDVEEALGQALPFPNPSVAAPSKNCATPPVPGSWPPSNYYTPGRWTTLMSSPVPKPIPR